MAHAALLVTCFVLAVAEGVIGSARAVILGLDALYLTFLRHRRPGGSSSERMPMVVGLCRRRCNYPIRRILVTY